MIDDLEALQPLLDRIPPEWPRTLEVHDGWAALLVTLDHDLASIAPQYVLHQCKSKFGALSFYAQVSDDPYAHLDAFDETIRAAEWRSTVTCEFCGVPGRQYVTHAWVWTLCSDHAAQLDTH